MINCVKISILCGGNFVITTRIVDIGGNSETNVLLSIL